MKLISVIAVLALLFREQVCCWNSVICKKGAFRTDLCSQKALTTASRNRQSWHHFASTGSKRFAVQVDNLPTVNSGSWLTTAKAVWDFTRPHTIIGSCVSILSLYMYAVPSTMWVTPEFIKSLIGATIPSLMMNLYITGLNQATDVDIDKINKPYLPLASGSLSQRTGVRIVLGSLILALLNIKDMAWPLQFTLVGSALLGTLYSLPPFRLKRFPLLAAL